MKHIAESLRIFQNYERRLDLVAFLSKHSRPVELVSSNAIVALNSYHRCGFAGTAKQMFCREAVLLKLNEVQRSLGSQFRLIVYDAFRSKQTQLAIFMHFRERIRFENHELTEDEVLELTRNFVAHPDEAARFIVPPHNSGGAVDLSLIYKGKELFMGTEFDATVPHSATDFFERDFDPSLGFTRESWKEACSNRRILFNAMRASGFVNYPEEWWHYDLGDCIWAEAMGSDWF